jgi:membrane protein YdbS with pleckstrin-like domain
VNVSISGELVIGSPFTVQGYKPIRISPKTQLAWYIISQFCVCILIALMVGIFKYWHHPVMKQSARVLLLMILLGVSFSHPPSNLSQIVCSFSSSSLLV